MYCISIAVMKSDTDTGNMQKEAMSVTEQVEKRRSDIEKDGTGRRKKPDISHLAGLYFNKIVIHFEARN